MSNEKSLPERLRDFPFFSQIPLKAVQQMALYLRRRSYRKEKALYYQEDVSDAAYFVLSGEIRIIKWRVDGTPYLLDKAYPGEWLGLPEIISHAGYLSDAVTDMDSELAYLHSTNLEVLLSIPAFQRAVIRTMATGYSRLHIHLEAHTPDMKIGAYLLSLIDRSRIPRNDDSSAAAIGVEMSGQGCIIPITQESIAAATGLSRETVNKHLRLLQDAGSIRVHRGKIQIINPAGLSPR